MITGIESYKLLFMIQLIIAERILMLRIERKQNFIVRYAISSLALLLAAAVFPVVRDSAGYISFLFLALFLLTLLALRFCYEEPFGNLLFCGVAGYTVQHLAYLLYTTFNDITGFDAVFGSFVQPYTTDPIAWNKLSALSIVLYVDAYFLVYYAAFELLDPKLKANHNLRLGRNNIVALSGLLMASDVIFNMITNYYTVGNQVSLLLERSYNILVCILILALLNNQLSQRELKDELAGIQYVVEQGTRHYELAKKNMDLVNIKYHDLRHQSEKLRRQGSAEELAELDRTLDEYAALIETGNEALNVILTEKTLSCREQNIQLMCMADGRGLEFIKTHHLYSLLGNAIDNAIEAVQELSPEQKLIGFSLKRQGDMLHIHVENPCAGKLRMKDGLPLTTKEDTDFHGFGMLSMKTIAEKYGGALSVQVEDGIFCLDIILSTVDSEPALQNTTAHLQNTTKV